MKNVFLFWSSNGYSLARLDWLRSNYHTFYSVLKSYLLGQLKMLHVVTSDDAHTIYRYTMIHLYIYIYIEGCGTDFVMQNLSVSEISSIVCLRIFV